jgi:predicted dehydrogenase
MAGEYPVSRLWYLEKNQMSTKRKSTSRRQFLAEGSKIAGAGVLGLAASPVLLKSNIARAVSPDKRIKIGQIGTAHAHARGKMQTLRKLDREYEVVGIVEPDPSRRQAMKDRPAYKGLKWMTEEQLLNTKGLQAVAVETAKRDLVPTAMRCVNAGMRIHLDKPPGESLSAFRKLLAEATRRGLTVQMGYMFRNNPAFQLCFKAVREGWLGDVFEVHGVISKTISTSKRKELAKYTGGTMFNLGCHLIDSLVTVLGKPENVTAYVRRTRPTQDNLADNQLAVFEYPKATATIRSAVIEVEGGRRRQFVVCGDRGTVDIRPLEPSRLQLALDGPQSQYKKGYQEVKLPPMPGRYDDQLIEFARIIRGELESDYTPSHDLAVHEAVLRASGLALD